MPHASGLPGVSPTLRGGGCNRTAVPSLVYPSATRFILVSRSSPFYRARLFPLASSSPRRGSSSLSPSFFPTATACLGPHRHSRSTTFVCAAVQGEARPPRTRTPPHTRERSRPCMRAHVTHFRRPTTLCVLPSKPTLVVHTPFPFDPLREIVLSYTFLACHVSSCRRPSKQIYSVCSTIHHSVVIRRQARLAQDLRELLLDHDERRRREVRQQLRQLQA